VLVKWSVLQILSDGRVADSHLQKSLFKGQRSKRTPGAISDISTGFADGESALLRMNMVRFLFLHIRSSTLTILAFQSRLPPDPCLCLFHLPRHLQKDPMPSLTPPSRSQQTGIIRSPTSTIPHTTRANHRSYPLIPLHDIHRISSHRRNDLQTIWHTQWGILDRS
jgi:hypothetical protein